MAQIYQPKKSGGIMSSKIGKVGLGFAVGGPVGAGLALAGSSNPAVANASGLYSGFSALSNGGSKPDEPSAPVNESYLGGSGYSEQLDPYGVSNSSYGMPAMNRYKAFKYGGG